MAKYQLRTKAREFRSKGLSLKEIAKELTVSRSSVSRWVSDIILTERQLSMLKESESLGKQVGRLKSIAIKNKRREERIELNKKFGRQTFSSLSRREFLIGGLALYWGEGGKTNKRIEFCNSDPKIIRFIVEWLKECFEVKNEDLRAVVGINQIHYTREKIVKDYWSHTTRIPLEQFRKTSFKKTINKKTYDNFDNHYGTLSILVIKSTKLFYSIIGLIDGLYSSKISESAG